MLYFMKETLKPFNLGSNAQFSLLTSCLLAKLAYDEDIVCLLVLTKHMLILHDHILYPLILPIPKLNNYLL